MNAQSWRIGGEAVVLCNCDWGCPCQFNALPTTGRCEAVGVWEVRKGHFGPTGLEGVRFARIYSWPGPIHEGNGTRQLIVDEKADEQQRQALDALDRGEEGGPYFEVFAAVCPNRLETVTTPIEMRNHPGISTSVPGRMNTLSLAKCSVKATSSSIGDRGRR